MINLIIANLKQLFRNRQALFWSIAFPLLFLFIFGSFFGRDTLNAGTVGIINKSDSELSKTIEKTFSDNNAFKIKKYDNIDAAKTDLKKSQINTILLIPEKFGNFTVSPTGLTIDPSAPNDLTIISDPGSAQTSSIVTGIIDKILAGATLQAQGAKPLYNIKQETSSTNKVTYFDFILAGLIGMSLMNSAVQGMAISIAKFRDEKILKRITTTPLPSWKFVVSQITSHLFLNFIQISLLILVGRYAFKAHIYGSIFFVYYLALLGAILFLIMGFVVAALSKTTEAAEGMATAISVPMMFLGGVFFPLDSLPKWLYSIVQYIPLAPLLRLIRNVSIDGVNPFLDYKNMSIVFIWIVLLLLIAVWRFKFNEE